MAEPFDEFPSDFAFDSVGNLYAALGSIRKFDRVGNFVGNFGTLISARQFVFNAENFAYVATFSALPNLRKLNPSGVVIRSYSVDAELPGSARISSLDLAADQCTLYYVAQTSRILRYDVCTETQLPVFFSGAPAEPEDISVIRILRGGEVLIVRSSRITRLSSMGVAVRDYDLPTINNWVGLALDADGESFWASTQARVVRFRLRDGAEIGSFNVSDYVVRHLAVVGEPRAALVAVGEIPTMAEVVTAFLAMSLALVAVARLR